MLRVVALSLNSQATVLFSEDFNSYATATDEPRAMAANRPSRESHYKYLLAGRSWAPQARTFTPLLVHPSPILTARALYVGLTITLISARRLEIISSMCPIQRALPASLMTVCCEGLGGRLSTRFLDTAGRVR